MSEKQKISVLMSVYVKENPTFLRDAIKSVQNQTLKPSELVLVEDGPLTPELYQVLDEVEAQSDIPVKRCPLEENQGLGLALRYGVLQCQYDIIARMDTDDIAVADRFEKQVQLMEEENLDLLGGHIAEFIDNPDEIVSYRRVPTQHADIVAYQRMRSAFNHMTVMFKKDMVLKAGNYEDGLYMEDDLLWLNMIAAGAKTGNLDQILCKVRVVQECLNVEVVCATSNSIVRLVNACLKEVKFPTWNMRKALLFRRSSHFVRALYVSLFL